MVNSHNDQKAQFREADRLDSERLRSFDYGHQIDRRTLAILESLLPLKV